MQKYQYQYSHDGTTTRYTVDGTEYQRLEDVPEPHRTYFANMDKNKNGVPDNVEGFLDAIQDSSGKTSFRKAIGFLFKTMGETIAQDRTETVPFEEVKEEKLEVKEEKRVEEPRRAAVEPRRTYDKQGRVVQQGESSFLPTLIKILVATAVVIGILWFLGIIK